MIVSLRSRALQDRRPAAAAADPLVDTALHVRVVFHVIFDGVRTLGDFEFVRRHSRDRGSFGPSDERIASQIAVAWLSLLQVFGHSRFLTKSRHVTIGDDASELNAAVPSMPAVPGLPLKKL